MAERRQPTDNDGDLAAVWQRLTGDMADTVVRDWLHAHNDFLGGTPVDAIRGGRTDEVAGAWDAYMAGGYA